MKTFNRRKFLQTSSILLAAPAIPSLFLKQNKMPLLSFSTLGCPDWSFETIIKFAAQNRYQGIELRGIQREMDFTKCPQFSSAKNIAATMAAMKDNGLRFVDLGSSANMHVSDVAERKKNLDEARAFIDLAEKIGCPFIRVFPNSLPTDKSKEASLSLIAEGLQQLGEYAKGSHVSVLMETHGDLVHTDDLLKVMSVAAGPHVGLVWDITNMWVITRQPPEDVYNKLKSYICHAHIKDAIVDGDKITYKLLGQGQVPIFTAIDLLYNGGYKGFYSFEWEKLWHPEMADPEIALADYSKAMRKHFNE